MPELRSPADVESRGGTSPSASCGVIAARVRWSWLNGPGALTVVMTYLLLGLPYALIRAGQTSGAAALVTAIVGLFPLVLFGLAQAFSVEIRAGADGVLFRWFGWTKFLAYRDIRTCAAFHEDVAVGRTTTDGDDATILHLRLKNGRSVEVRSGGLGLREGRFEQGAQLVRQIREGIAAAQRDTTDEAANQLARGEKPATAWLDELARRARRHGYRDTALDRDELLRVVESSVAAPTARVGAAAILRKSGLRDEERARVRVAAEASVAPHVHIALEAAADADLEERAFDEAAVGAARAERR